jgi:predicted metalloprotease with PDZ domain
MDDTRPAGVPELDSLGWPGLVSGLRVTDRAGRALAVARRGARGWMLERPETTTVTVEYDVDLGPLARLDWPAPREAAWRDSAHVVLVGRALFAFTAASRACRVAFELPARWRASTAWRATGPATFVAASAPELVENLLVLASEPPDEVTAGGFRLHVTSLGAWAADRDETRRLLAHAVRHHVAAMGFRGNADYVVVLLPQRERGGESYRHSFALNLEDPPGPASRTEMGNLVAHEIFHLWNGWALQGADYASTQWFQEGFTEYVANVTMASAPGFGEDWLRDRLAAHVRNARRLTGAPEAMGTHKGPPLYAAGALVAFAWDVRIRAATHGGRDLSDFFRELLRRTDGGARAYAWPDLRAALETTAPGDWEREYQSYVHGAGPLPVAEALAATGQRLVEAGDGTVRIGADPAATADAKRSWRRLARGR